MGKKIALVFIVVLVMGFVLPEKRVIPVQGATTSDWHPKTFWFEPWGTSGVHKGIDIFARKGTPVLAATNLLILYRGTIFNGGKVMIAIGPAWRIHYFAHLQDFPHKQSRFYAAGQEIGTVGDSGNAKGKPPHLHYSIMNLLPAPWRMDFSTQGYKKMFYLDPGEYLRQ